MAEGSPGALRVAIGRVSQGEEIAATGGLILLVALFLKWYAVSSTISVNGVDIHLNSAGHSVSGWHALSVGHWLFLACSLLAIAIAAARAYGRELNLPLKNGFLLFVLGGLSTLWIALRLVSYPGDYLSLRLGPAVGLAGAAFLTIGAQLMRREANPGFLDHAGHPAADA